MAVSHRLSDVPRHRHRSLLSQTQPVPRAGFTQGDDTAVCTAGHCQALLTANPHKTLVKQLGIFCFITGNND